MRHVFVFFTIILLGVGSVQGQQNGYGTCPYESGTYYQDRLYPRYERRNHRVVLVSLDTGAVISDLETSFSTGDFHIINWSTDCRYVSALIRPAHHFADKQILVWDINTGSRIHTFDVPYDSHSRGAYFYPELSWNPDSTRVIVQTTIGYYLWQPATDSTVLLTNPTAVGRIFKFPELGEVYWDETRNFVILNRPIIAYDLQTGVERFRFSGNFYIISDDKTKIVTDAYVVGDLDNLSSIRVNGESRTSPYESLHMALSADNRYLVAGLDALRVWDIQNLPEKVEDRLPIYRHGGPKALIWSVRFADSGVIETTSEEGTQKWDLHTGEYIP
jgi:WD40 repeat protein